MASSLSAAMDAIELDDNSVHDLVQTEPAKPQVCVVNL